MKNRIIILIIGHLPDSYTKAITPQDGNCWPHTYCNNSSNYTITMPKLTVYVQLMILQLSCLLGQAGRWAASYKRIGQWEVPFSHVSEKYSLHSLESSVPHPCTYLDKGLADLDMSLNESKKHNITTWCCSLGNVVGCQLTSYDLNTICSSQCPHWTSRYRHCSPRCFSVRALAILSVHPRLGQSSRRNWHSNRCAWTGEAFTMRFSGENNCRAKLLTANLLNWPDHLHPPVWLGQ